MAAILILMARFAISHIWQHAPAVEAAGVK
jgi:hypothetical protein